MSDTDSNTPAGAFSPEDTKTRKTVRLHPPQSSPSLLKQDKIADPLSGRDTDTSNLEILDDTQTRRTVKIKPLAPPAASPVKIPLDAENTNTRKTVVLHPQPAASGQDTRTRKTVVLRPGTAAPAAPAPATPNPAVEVSDETVAVAKPKTVQKPAVPIAPAPAKAAPAPVPPAPAVEVSDETVAVTKPKTVQKPAVPIAPAPVKTAPAPAPAAPAPAPAPAAPAPAPAPAAPAAQAAAPEAKDDDDQTVKIKRPAGPPRIGPRPMGQPGAKAPTLARPAAPGASADTASKAEAEEDADIKETVKLPQPKRPAGVPFGPRATPAKPAAPAKPATPFNSAASPKPAPPVPAQEPDPEELSEDKDEEDGITLAPSEKKRAQEGSENDSDAAKPGFRKFGAGQSVQNNAASPVYLVLGLITLLLMLGATVFSLAQYLDFEQKIQIYDHIPGLPRSK